MANSPGSDNDDDFSDLYKEYTGPVGSKATSVPENENANKRSHGNSDDEEEPHDPNAIPTGFTSREAKVWEVKSKATERNWKKRKEEEMICKLCGESGHFTQGCPSTLGAGRKSQDFFERVPAREPHVKALFTEKVIQNIEKDIGCKIKVEEKFIIVSGKDRLILKKGVDAVHKVKEEGERKGSSDSRMSRSRSPPDQSIVGSRLGRSDSQRSRDTRPSPQNPPQFQNRFNREDKFVEDRVRDDLQKMSRGSPSVYGNDGAQGRSSRSKSPTRHPGNSYNSYDNRGQSMRSYMTDERDSERRALDLQFGRNCEQPVFPKTLEELELEYKRETMELGIGRNKEEDEENKKHREAIREIRENHMKKLSLLRGNHGKQWEDFLHLDVQRRQQQAHSHQLSSSNAGFGGYKQPPSYPPPEYNSPGAENHNHYGGSRVVAMDSRGNFPNSAADNSYDLSRRYDNYRDNPRQRREEYGKAYNRY